MASLDRMELHDWDFRRTWVGLPCLSYFLIVGLWAYSAWRHRLQKWAWVAWK